MHLVNWKRKLWLDSWKNCNCVRTRKLPDISPCKMALVLLVKAVGNAVLCKARLIKSKHCISLLPRRTLHRCKHWRSTLEAKVGYDPPFQKHCTYISRYIYVDRLWFMVGAQQSKEKERSMHRFSHCLYFSLSAMMIVRCVTGWVLLGSVQIYYQ
jgi:hypothetical protein